MRVAGGNANSHEGVEEEEESDKEEATEAYEWEEDNREEEYPLWGVIPEDRADDCPSCTAGSNRNAWRLIIHPSDTASNYYRVGIFTSRAGGAGGTELFADLGNQELTLIQSKPSHLSLIHI